MIERRSHRPGKAPPFPPPDLHAWPTVYLVDRSRHADIVRDSWVRYSNPFEVGWWIPPSSSGEYCATLKAALATFDRKVKGLERKGWRETEWSLTRRAFGHPSAQQPTKFWAVALDGATLTVQFGKVRPGRPGTMGTTRPKAFPSPEAARAAYDELISAKRAQKYREIMPREVSTADLADARAADG